ncbi:MAG TPA: L,D-transpeptidase [Acidobacteriaceae bacterium]|nr:L,D-transpeptidase [Acidobacteriaceae bacterium]
MSSRVRVTILSAVSFLILFTVLTAARAQNAATGAVVNAQPERPAITRLIIVSLKDRRLALVENGQVKALYPVAIGKSSTPSPTGTFTIATHVINPTYYHHGKVIPPGPENPVGNRWMGLSVSGYGIHGTNIPRSIGRAASHGCIRMGRRDLERLFAQVRVGDTVEIVGQRDEQTVAIFGGQAVPQSAFGAAPVLTARALPEASPANHATVTVAMAAIPAGQ